MNALFRLMITILLLYVSAFFSVPPGQTAPPGPATTSPQAFYQSLADAIDSTQGRLLLYLNDGCWGTRVDGFPVLWRIPNNTVAEIRFHFERGTLDDTEGASIEFRPNGIDVGSFINNQLTWIHVTAITYNGDGDPTSPQQLRDNIGLSRTFEFSTTPGDLFKANLFFNITAVSSPGDGQGCDSNPANWGPPTAGTIAWRIRFQKSQQDPGLSVRLRRSTIFVSTPLGGGQSPADNFLNVTSPSNFEFDSIDYILRTRSLDATLRALTFTLEGGRIDAGNFTLLLGQARDPAAPAIDSGLIFDNVVLHSAPGSVSSVIAKGVLKAAIAAGSKIILNDDAASPTQFSFAEGSRVSLQGFSLEIFDDHRSITVRLDHMSMFDIRVLDGRLSFGPRGGVSVGSGRILTNVFGMWQVGRSPIVTGTIDVLDIAAQAGQLVLTDGSTIALAPGGALKATRLALKSPQSPAITGPFTVFAVKLAANQVISLLPGLSLRLSDIGTIIADDATDPLRIDVGHAYPLGRYRIDLPYSDATYAQGMDLQLRAGRVSSQVRNVDDASTVGRVLFALERLQVDGSILSGSIGFGNLGNLKVADGRISVTAQGSWIPGQAGRILGDITVFRINIASGSLNVTSQGILRISGGMLRSGGLKIDTSAERPIFGTVDSLVADVSAMSRIRFPAGLVVTAKDSKAAFNATDATNPLRIQPSGPPLIGSYILNLNFDSIASDDSSSPQLLITNGSLLLQLNNASDGSLTGSGCVITGSLGIRGNVDAKYLAVEIRGDLVVPAGGAFRFNGSWRATIPAGSLRMAFTTSPIIGLPGADGARVFGVNLIGALAQDIQTGFVPIQFEGSNVRTAIGLQGVAFNLTVPQGGGEHSDPENVDSPTKGNRPDQEVFTDTYLACLGGRVHIYLLARTYRLSMDLNINWDQAGLTLAYANLDLKDKPKVDKDGCDLELIGAITGAFISTLVAGNPIPGLVLGFAAGGAVEDQVHDILIIRAAERIHELRGSFHVTR